MLRDCPVPLSTMGRGLDRGPGLLPGRGRSGRHAATLGGAGPTMTWSGPACERSVREAVRIAATRGSCCPGPPLARSSVNAGLVQVAAAAGSSRRHKQAAVREIREETGLEISAAQVGPPRWRRIGDLDRARAPAAPARGGRPVRLDADAPPVTDGGRTAEELEEYVDARWWDVADVLGQHRALLPRPAARAAARVPGRRELTEPFERLELRRRPSPPPGAPPVPAAPSPRPTTSMTNTRLSFFLMPALAGRPPARSRAPAGSRASPGCRPARPPGPFPARQHLPPPSWKLNGRPAATDGQVLPNTLPVRQIEPTYCATTVSPLASFGPVPLISVVTDSLAGGAFFGMLMAGAWPAVAVTVGSRRRRWRPASRSPPASRSTAGAGRSPRPGCRCP